jgi:hypothetical protein
MTKPKAYALSRARAGLRGDEAPSRNAQIVAGRDDKRRHVSHGRLCVRCGGPRGAYPICPDCQGGAA